MKSMTGFGRAEGAWNGRQYRVEIKSLNSKQLDVNTRIPSNLREKEMQIRTDVNQVLGRGKVDVGIFCDDAGREAKSTLNIPVMQVYYDQINEFCKRNGLENSDILASIVRLPEVVSSDFSAPGEDEWVFISGLLKEALQMTDDYRVREGNAQFKMFSQTIQEILAQQKVLLPLVEARNNRLRTRLEKGLNELLSSEKLDQNRLEQEVILYIERWDIAEELQRLQENCSHFTTEMNEQSRGRTLGFIAQEMGREINTIGSKANDAEIQKIVVSMKESLEQVKEQLANVL